MSLKIGYLKIHKGEKNLYKKGKSTKIAYKIYKITSKDQIYQVLWWEPVISAIREAEAGESLEPGKQRLL